MQKLNEKLDQTQLRSTKDMVNSILILRSFNQSYAKEIKINIFNYFLKELISQELIYIFIYFFWRER